MIRILDLLISVSALLLLSPVFSIIYVLGLFDTGSPIFVQSRLGYQKRIFNLYKFRTMRVGTKSVSTHLVDSNVITKLGSILRKTKLDELPQLINVIKGDMSIVGPRPNLPDQDLVIDSRESKNIYSVKPGITGYAQVQQIDMSKPQLLAAADRAMIDDMSLIAYFNIIIQTILGKGYGDRIMNNDL